MGDQTILAHRELTSPRAALPGRRYGHLGWLVKGVCAVIGCAAVLVVSACAPGPAAEMAIAASPWTAASGSPGPAASQGAATGGPTVTITAVGDMMLGNTPNLPSDPA